MSVADKPAILLEQFRISFDLLRFLTGLRRTLGRSRRFFYRDLGLRNGRGIFRTLGHFAQNFLFRLFSTTRRSESGRFLLPLRCVIVCEIYEILRFACRRFAAGTQRPQRAAFIPIVGYPSGS